VIIPSDEPSRRRYYQQLREQCPEAAGWAALDRDVIPQSDFVYCIAIKREVGAISHDVGSAGTIRPLEDDAYHVLVIRSVPFSSTPTRYVRIGIGVVAASYRQWFWDSVEIV